ncbi:MAG: hypothetical protein JW844_04250 [Candidatus Omnitrophica bacterium]|nr:hypothetical protein [Candidatus Omnitrophota bacterium]
MNTQQIWHAFVISLILSFGFTPLVKYLAEKKGLVAKPKEDRWHKRPTALLGGVAIIASFLVSFWLFAEHTAQFWQLCSVCIVIFALGLVDDIVGLPPYTKLAGQIIVACLFAYFGFYLNIINPLIGLPLTILWMVGIVNAFNLLDNMDGLSAGVACISSIFLCLYSLSTDSYFVALLSALIAGSTLGFLYFNVNPAKIFMGDCGSHFLGFALAAATVFGSFEHASNLMMTLSFPVMVLSVPIFDTIFVTFMRRLYRKSIVQGGKDHTSHRLVALGLSERRAVLVLYAISTVAGVIVLLNRRWNTFMLFTAAGLFMVVLFFFGMFLGEVKIYSEEEVRRAQATKRNNNVFLNGLILYKRRIVEVGIDFLLICISYIAAYLLRYEGVISEGNAELILKSLPIIIAIKLPAFFYFGLYRGVWRYVSLQDIVAIFKAVIVGSSLSVCALVYLFRFEGFSRTAFIIDGLLLFLLISGSRTTLRLLQELFSTLPKKDSRRVLIMGAGDMGELLLRAMRNNSLLHYLPVGFVDDDSKKLGKKIHGIPVLGTQDDMVTIAKREGVQEIIVAMSPADQTKTSRLFEECRKNNITVRHTSSFTHTALKSDVQTQTLNEMQQKEVCSDRQ